jgi:flavin-dependent dehydrogenase
MVGDAFGFIDPMLSPGVFLALRSAELLADALAPGERRRAIPSPPELDAALAAYAARQQALLAAWFELVAYLYDGRLVALMRAGRDWMTPGSGFLKARMEHYIARHVGLLASGAATTSRYSRGLLRFLSRYALRGVDPRQFAIR